MGRTGARCLFWIAVLYAAQFCGVFAQTVEVPTTALRLEIVRSAHQVRLYRGEKSVKSFPVAVGRSGWETPLGTFRVFQMLRDPDWEHPLTREIFEAGEPGNELGRYWIGFAKQGENCVGFHATPHPNTVGKSLSHGCIRMYEKDIQELFAQVEVGTTVKVLP